MTAFMNALAEGFDLPILDWIAARLHSPVMDGFMSFITHFGDAGLFWIAVAVLLLCLPKYRRLGLGMGLSLLIGLLICNITLKPLIARMRPYDYQWNYFQKEIELLIAAPKDYSFPSGHTLASFESATVLMLNDRRLGIPALILACLVAFSRLYLYVHYPSDVLFALVAGVGIGFLGNWLAKVIFQRLAQKKQPQV